MTSNNKVVSINLTPFLLLPFTSCLPLQLYTIYFILIILRHLFSCCHFGLNVINVFCIIYIPRTILKIIPVDFFLAITAYFINSIINYCSRDNLCLFLFYMYVFAVCIFEWICISFVFQICWINLNTILFSSLRWFWNKLYFPFSPSIILTNICFGLHIFKISFP